MVFGRPSRVSLLTALLAFTLLLSPLSAQTKSRYLPPSVQELLELIAANERYRIISSEEGFAEEAMLRGIVAALEDPYAVVLDTTEQVSSDTSTDGESLETGLLLGEDQYRRLIAQAVLPGSPAEVAGLRAGDRILRIGGVDAAGLRVWDALPLLRATGEPPISLVVEASDGGVRELSLEPFPFEPETVELRIGELRRGRWKDDLNGEFAWIRIHSFLGERTLQEWSRRVETIRENPSVRRIVLDLRDNGGGDNATIPLMGDFFRHGQPLVRFESLYGDGQRSETVRTYGRPRSRLMGYPAVVLVNGRTASLAEIAAVALKDNRRVQVVGTRTFGKGTTQTWVRTGERFAIHLTVGRWYGPAGASVEGTGLEPDVIALDDPSTRRDEALVAALRVLSSHY
jgi:carboxyl-terminal processing protease